VVLPPGLFLYVASVLVIFGVIQYAARYYHETMLANGATSTHFAVGGSNHNTNPAIFGVVASWVLNLLALAAPGVAGPPGVVA
jgi:hypothetical protein